ncbi:hypothetical protein [uncultured Kingella sp.]|jgi:hypothetical protein|nr:hypothetical protein [uncultured Kingella sp.]
MADTRVESGFSLPKWLLYRENQGAMRLRGHLCINTGINRLRDGSRYKNL